MDVSAANFLRLFTMVGLIRGHFAGNKGFQFGCLPRFDDSFEWRWDETEDTRRRLQPNADGLRGRRAIPLGLRYNVLDRDGGRCQACGRTPPVVTLHVDHITPYSLGGLTVLDNLQTLCGECNIGKGNRSVRSFVAN